MVKSRADRRASERHVSCRFELQNRSGSSVSVDLALPFSTHTMFGDHGETEFVVIENRDPEIVLGPVGEMFMAYHGQDSHPYFEIAIPIAEFGVTVEGSAPPGLELAAYWNETFRPYEVKNIDVEFTWFSGFSCVHPRQNYFVFGTENATLWPEEVPIAFAVTGHVDVQTTLPLETDGEWVLASGTCGADALQVGFEVVATGGK